MVRPSATVTFVVGLGFHSRPRVIGVVWSRSTPPGTLESPASRYSRVS